MAYDPQNPKAHYNLDIRVPPEIIEEIRQLGMEEALKKARSGEASPEFAEGVSRFYPHEWTDRDKDQYLQQGPIDERALNEFNAKQAKPFEGMTSPQSSTAPSRPSPPSQDAVQRALSGGGSGSPVEERPMPTPESYPVRQNPSVGPLAGTGSPQSGPARRGVLPNIGPRSQSSGLNEDLSAFASSLSSDSDVREQPIDEENDIISKLKRMLTQKGNTPGYLPGRR